MRKVDVAIIGAGSAGLSARREVAKETQNYVVIDDGPLGTTCARVGCMPSKVLIQVANDFHRRKKFDQVGIRGGAGVSLDDAAVMRHVRKLRDRFVRGVMSGIEAWRDTNLIRGRARFVSPNQLEISTADGEESIQAKRIILGTGSTPIMPGAWRSVSHRLFDSNGIFELESLPKSVAVIGLGVIGLELGQALARLGVQVRGFTLDKRLGGLSDPAIQDYAFAAMSDEFPITLAGVDSLTERDGKLWVAADGAEFPFDKALLAMGRRPNVRNLGLEEIGVPMDARGIPVFDGGTFRIEGTPIYIAGDVNAQRPILHEASDEGRIAGFNSVRDTDQCFRRRTLLAITFSDPNIAVVGQTYDELEAEGADYVVGEVTYEGQGRAIVKLKERGLMHVYVEQGTGRLLGAELMAPDGEHLAHLLAWAMSAGLTVFDALSLPFYHPVVEEGLRTALRAAARLVKSERPALEVLRCQDPPVGCWS